MNKTIIFGCILAVFLILTFPLRPAVEYQNKKDLITDGKQKSDNVYVIKLIKQITLEKWQEISKSTIFGSDPDQEECIAAAIMFFSLLPCLVTPIFIFPIYIWYIAMLKGCLWAIYLPQLIVWILNFLWSDQPNKYHYTNLPCSIC
jgi:hypothetical protein